jgi:hypothetical protein
VLGEGIWKVPNYQNGLTHKLLYTPPKVPPIALGKDIAAGALNYSGVSGVCERIGKRLASELGTIVRRARACRGSIFFDTNRSVANSILIAGSGRGGTTWLSEIINSTNEFRQIFEPFYPAKVPSMAHFKIRQYLRREDSDKRYLDPAKQAFSGAIRSVWSDQFNRRILCSRRLIKDIRVNLLLPWIRAHFPELRIVLILRHPCAVANSRLSLGWPTTRDLRDLMSQDALIEDHLRPILHQLQGLESEFEKHILIWCIENYVPLHDLSDRDVLVVFYENLCIQPEIELRRLCDYLSLKHFSSMLANVKKPSTQTRRNASSIMLSEDLVLAWKRYVEPRLLLKAQELLNIFGLSYLYDDEGLPPAQAGKALPRLGRLDALLDNEPVSMMSSRRHLGS